jgi:transcriptional regulator of met regulon
MSCTNSIDFLSLPLRPTSLTIFILALLNYRGHFHNLVRVYHNSKITNLTSFMDRCLDDCCKRCYRCDGSYRNSDYCHEHSNHPLCSCDDKCKECGDSLLKGFCHNCKSQRKPNIANSFLIEMYKRILDIHKSLECKDNEKAQTQVDSLEENVRNEILIKGFCHNCKLQCEQNIENSFLIEMYKMILNIHKSLKCKDSEKAQTQVDSLEESARNEILCYCGKIHE